jgi:hypothetical protein
MNLLFILALTVLFPATHLLSGWLFDFATFNDHISLIYLPAFLRLFNLLVLGPLKGTIATFLGGLLLMNQFEETTYIGLLNIVCSSSGPLIALLGYQFYFKRQVQLTSLKDLATLSLMYCVCNSLIHHLVWSLAIDSFVWNYQEAIWMFIGDMVGTLFGAYLLKSLVDLMNRKGFKFSGP